MSCRILRFVVCFCVITVGLVHAAGGVMTGSGTAADHRVQGAGSSSLRLPSWGTGAYVQVFTAGEIKRKDRIMVVK